MGKMGEKPNRCKHWLTSMSFYFSSCRSGMSTYFRPESCSTWANESSRMSTGNLTTGDCCCAIFFEFPNSGWQCPCGAQKNLLGMACRHWDCNLVLQHLPQFLFTPQAWSPVTPVCLFEASSQPYMCCSVGLQFIIFSVGIGPVKVIFTGRSGPGTSWPKVYPTSILKPKMIDKSFECHRGIVNGWPWGSNRLTPCLTPVSANTAVALVSQ